MTHRSPETRWSCPLFGSLLWETWESEHFVLNPRSGETHVLNALAGAILSTLAETPCSLYELVESFHAELQGAGDSPPERVLDELLSQLDQLGLIDPASDEDR